MPHARTLAHDLTWLQRRMGSGVLVLGRKDRVLEMEIGPVNLQCRPNAEGSLSGVGCGFRPVASPGESRKQYMLQNPEMRGLFLSPGWGLRIAGPQQVRARSCPKRRSNPPTPLWQQTPRLRAKQGLTQTGQVSLLCVLWPLVR